MKVKIIKDKAGMSHEDKNRIFHDISGTFGDYYFTAITSNCHLMNHASYGINKKAVHRLYVWAGSLECHTGKDLVASYRNKWEIMPRGNMRKMVNQLVEELEIIANTPPNYLQKATEIFESYLNIIPKNSSRRKIAKDCSIRAVDEILSGIDAVIEEHDKWSVPHHFDHRYWKEVRAILNDLTV